MNLSDLNRVFRIFRGETLVGEERDALFKEALLMILSRATVVDTNIGTIEVSTVQKIFLDQTGEAIDEKDIRVTAIAKQYETASFDRFVSKVGDVLDTGDRIHIAKALADVLAADGSISPFEFTFFNDVVKLLRLTPADVAMSETIAPSTA